MTSEVLFITGCGIPLRGNDIDTDRIIPARFLRCVSFNGLGDQVFKDDREQQQGSHPFDLPQYHEARILVVNANFGCGSSREHAPQSLMRWGIQALVGESFAEIFFGNCLALGIPCVVADVELINRLQTAIEQDPQLTLTLDLATTQLTWGDQIDPVGLAEGPRQMLVTGTWDACGQLLANTEGIRQTATQLPYMSWKHAS